MNLPEDKWIEIQNELSRAVNLQKRLQLPIDLIALLTNPQKKRDIALICLQDASAIFCEVVFSLTQAHAYLTWFREEHPSAPLESDACFYGKFYTDAASLRLYPAAEHAANFITNFLGIEEADLSAYKERYSSRAATVGTYMQKEQPNHKITEYLKSLHINSNWGDTMQYRNDWVHDQPPLVKGLGIRYERESRWKLENVAPELRKILNLENEECLCLEIGNQQQPRYTIDSLLEMVKSASLSFEALLSDLINLFIDDLKKLGMKFDEEAN